MRLDHTESFKELCRLASNPAEHLGFLDMYASHCEEDAAAGRPCLPLGMRDFATVRFVCDLWHELAAPALTRVFAAYVRHGIVMPNRKLVMTSDDVPTLYRQVNAMMPLEAAVLVGTLPAAEQLVLHGANVAGRFEGLDFFDFVRTSFGDMSPFDHTEEQQEAAAATLSRHYMLRVAHATPPVEPAPPPRRLRRGV